MTLMGWAAGAYALVALIYAVLVSEFMFGNLPKKWREYETPAVRAEIREIDNTVDKIRLAIQHNPVAAVLLTVLILASAACWIVTIPALYIRNRTGRQE